MQPKYFVEISPVREVTLVGVADLSYWSDQLRPERLRPADHDGYAQIIIIAVAARFMSISFRELSISICAREETTDPTCEGVFLAHAFNSVRFFAWSERTFFSTPYYHAAVAVDSGPPASFQVMQRSGVILAASMSADAGPSRQPIYSGPESSEIRIFLPHRKSKPKATDKHFFARLSGDTQTYPFDPNSDQLAIHPTAAAPVLQQLIDSHFTPHDWIIRPTATHARSTTVLRP